MRALYARREPLSGSRYKYSQMFSRVCELDHMRPPQDLSGYDFGIVEGDRCGDFSIFLSAGVPYILVEHDVWTMRNVGARNDIERQMIEGAACILFTSEDHVAFLEKRYRLPPYRIVHLRPLAQDLSFDPLPKLDGQNIVYAGGLVAWKDRDKLFGYRCYHEIFQALMGCGWDVHVYPAWRTSADDFQSIGCVVHEPVSQADIYRELSQYQAGFQGYALHGPQDYVHACRPNKLWEHLGAGIPTLGYNTGAGADLYRGKWGYVAKTMKGFAATSKRVLAMDIPDELRQSQVMDSDIDAFAELVEIAASAPHTEPIRPPGRRLQYPIKLGVDCSLGSIAYPRGTRVDRDVALALKADGQLTDPRIF